jgi:DNA/RNA-binding domain of Phe-tRNA-synthetase-like protein
MFQVSEAWQAAYPGAVMGALAMQGVANPEHDEALDAAKEALEAHLRAQFAGQNRKALAALPTIEAYSAYYAHFRKTYHVLLQLESVALKGRSLPRVAGLVEAMFMAELKNQLLTAGHDVATLALPVTTDIAQGTTAPVDEQYVTMSGNEQVLAPGDMYVRDGRGVISSIIYGPDRRTAISSSTQRVLFTVYGPPGISAGAVRRHLDDIRDNVLLISPSADVTLCEVFTAG